MSRVAAISWLTAALEMRRTGERPHDVLEAMSHVWIDEAERDPAFRESLEGELGVEAETEALLSAGLGVLLWQLTSISLTLMDMLLALDPGSPSPERTLQIIAEADALLDDLSDLGDNGDE